MVKKMNIPWDRILFIICVFILFGSAGYFLNYYLYSGDCIEKRPILSELKERGWSDPFCGDTYLDNDETWWNCPRDVICVNILGDG